MKRFGNFLLEDDEIRLMPFIVPEEYIERNLKKIDEEYALRFLQDQLHELANLFLNGGYSDAGFIFYPLIQGISSENLRKLQLMKKVMETADNRFQKTLDVYHSKRNGELCASVISQLSRDISECTGKKAKKSVNLKACERLELSQYKDKETKKNIGELERYSQKNLKGLLSGFFLHGSLATNDYIGGWSDCDTVSIVSKEAIDDPCGLLDLRKKLYALRGYFLRIDPLQHHGTIIISEYELEDYCSSYFPLEVFKYARKFFGEMPKRAYVRKSEGNELKAFFWFVNHFRTLDSSKSYNSYDIKNMLHAAALFPTLYLQANNVNVYKKFSFDMARKDFSVGEWKIIDEISALREQWKPYTVMPFAEMVSRINPILAYQLNVRIADRFSHIAKTNGLNTRRMIEEVRSLYEIGWSKIKKEELR